MPWIYISHIFQFVRFVKTFKRAGATTDTKRGALKEEEGV